MKQRKKRRDPSNFSFSISTNKWHLSQGQITTSAPNLPGLPYLFEEASATIKLVSWKFRLCIFLTVGTPGNRMHVWYSDQFVNGSYLFKTYLLNYTKYLNKLFSCLQELLKKWHNILLNSKTQKEQLLKQTPHQLLAQNDCRKNFF